MRTFLTTWFLLSVLLCAGTVRADDARAIFDSLYGPKVRAAQQTPERADDVAVAKELLAGASLVANQPELLAVICETAYDLGRVDPDGYATAVDAMSLLAKHVPAKLPDALEKIGDLYQRQFGAARGEEKNAIGAALIEIFQQQAALKIKAKQHDDATSLLRRAMNVARLIKSDKHDEIRDQLESLLERQKLQLRIDRLQADIEAAPNEQKVQELILLYIVELDDPGEASSFLLLSKDEALKKRVLLADDALSDVNEANALDMGEWYRGLANQASGTTAKRKMLTRATLYLKHFIALHGKEDLQTAKAQLMVNAMTPTLDKLGGAVAVSIPASSTRVVDNPSPVPSPAPIPILGQSEPLDLDKLKPVAFMTSEETGGLELIEHTTGEFSRGAMAGRRTIVMTDTNLFVKIDDRIARDLAEQTDDRWFLRVTALQRVKGFVGVVYDAHEGITFPPNGNGTYTQTPWYRIEEGGGWGKIDIELPVPRFANRHSTGADFKVIIGDGQKPFYIDRIELFRVKLQPASQRTIKPGQTVDLIKLVDLKIDPLYGQWEHIAAGLRLKREQFARTSMPVQVRGDYDMQVKFVRLGGTSSVNLMLPAGDRHVALVIDGYERDADGTQSGLETIDGKGVPRNETAVRGAKLTTDREHTVDVRVRVSGATAKIEADLDGQSLVRWTGSKFTLTGSAWRMQETYRPGLGGFFSDVEFRAATLKMIDGHALLLTPSRDQTQPQIASSSTNDAAAPIEAPAGGTSLAKLEEQVVFAKVFGKSGKLGSLVRIRINGVDLPGSVAVFPDKDKPAHIAYQIDGKYKTFLGAVGINDIGQDPYSEVTFRIMGDGKELWRSKPTKQREKVQPFQVDVSGVKKLELMVGAAGDPRFCNCVWVEPTLHEEKVRINLPSSRDNRGKPSFFGIPVE